MSGTILDIEILGLDSAALVLNRLGAERLLDEARPLVGGLIESQTRLRFQTETAPDGSAWAPWSDSYAKSRHRGHSLLVGDGHLRDSIHFQESPSSVQIGSNLVYAAIHQHGGEPGMPPGPAAIPAREYLGVNEENLSEINIELTAWLERTLH